MRNIHFGFFGVILVGLIGVFGYSKLPDAKQVSVPPDCKCSEGCKCKLEKCLCVNCRESTGCEKCHNGDKK